MSPKEAVTLLESLVLTVMQTGGFKDYTTLDTCRHAIEVLQDAVAGNDLNSVAVGPLHPVSISA